MRREPSLLYGLLTAALALLVAYGLIGADKVELWHALLAAALPIAQALFTRAQVVPVATVNEAGLTTGELKHRADDPNVAPVRESDFRLTA